MLKQFSDIQSPFAALRAQLNGITPNLPNGSSPIDLTIGAPRHPAPKWVQEKLDEAIDTVGNYPPIHGSEELQKALLNWAEKRYPSLKNHLTNDHILPLNGSREGLFYAIFIAKSQRPDIKDPIVLIPNPYYQVYGAAALAAGASPYFLNALPENNFLPNLDTVPEEILDRTIAFYHCSPSNPEGAMASHETLKKAIKCAREHNFYFFSDECYSEIYRDKKPISALETGISLANGPSAPEDPFDKICTFNSLSKRSNVPGIRSGVVMGEQSFIQAFKNFRNVAGPQIPGPIQHLSAHLWQDETHVEENRELYAKKLKMAETMLQNRFFTQKPQAGFFLWLNLSDFGGGIQAVSTLWKDVGLKLLPGAYLAQTDENGVNPGANYARMALVSSLDETEEALKRLLRVFG